MPGAPSTSSACKGSVCVTRQVRVAVEPAYMPEHSDPAKRRFVFEYRIRIANDGGEPVTLRSRRWTIVDARGRREQVEGEGVVGRQPRIEPGQAFVYSSYCPLATPWGTMEGSFAVQTDQGEEFHLNIARFYLVAEQA